MFHLTRKNGDSKVIGDSLHIWHKGAWTQVIGSDHDGAFVELVDGTIYAKCEDGTYW